MDQRQDTNAVNKPIAYTPLIRNIRPADCNWLLEKLHLIGIFVKHAVYKTV